MFTGIVRYLGIIKSITHFDNYSTIVIFSAIDDIVKIGDSICINGICLTVVNTSQDNYEFTFNVINETKLKTSFNLWKEKDEVNIELSLKNDKFDGHIVTGHVDCIGTLLDIKDNIFFFKTADEIKSLITDKGSISIDGVSLTISTCFNSNFTVSIIPHTLEWTIFKNYKINTIVNIEVDYRLKKCDNYYGNIENMIGKYILSDEHAMNIALTLSEKGLYSAPPNPHVGCIITKDKKIIGMGYHHSPGNPHAEVEAFEKIISARTSGYFICRTRGSIQQKIHLCTRGSIQQKSHLCT
jgi:riboflavin synthase